jgi:2-hydroxychromene-2-carboxylate isomerase
VQRRYTAIARAEADAVFGVPAMLLDGALFWGLDALPVLAWRLAGGPR